VPRDVSFPDHFCKALCLGVCIGLLVAGGVIILAAVTHEATRSTQMAGDTMPPLDPSALIPMPDAATQARNRADFVRGVAYLRNPGAYVWVTPPMDPGPPDPVGYAGPSLQYPSLEDLTVRSPRTGPEEVCVVWPGPSRQASLWPLTTGAPGEQVDAPLVWMAKRKLGDLQPLHQPSLNPLIEQRLRQLSDQQLLDAVFNPSDGRLITVYPGGSVAIDGNTRLYEMQRRMHQNPSGVFHRDLEIPVIEKLKAPLDPNLPDDY